MASREKKKQSLQDLIRQGLSEADHSMFADELFRGTDRSCALISCTMVDNTLVMALRSRFVSMPETDFESLFYSPTAPLSSFSSRIRIAHAMGILSNQRRGRLDLIRKVRNAFAHSLRPILFAEPLITKECLLLPDATIDIADKIRALVPQAVDEIRWRYMSNCINMAFDFEDFASANFGSQITLGIPDHPA